MTRRVSGLYIVLALAVLAFMTATPALAEDVTYSTTGGFSANGGANTATFGAAANTLTLSFNGVAATDVDAEPTTFGTAGTITATVKGTGASASGTFTLTIDQTAPSVGSGGLSGTLSGKITSNSSNGILNFTSTTLILGDIEYTVQQPNGGYFLVPPNQGGTTSVQLEINATAVPEPAFFGLTGLGFFGLAGIAYRRYRQGRA